MEQRTTIPHIQVRSNALVYYSTPEKRFTYKRHDLTKLSTYTGTVTDSAAARIKRTVDVFLQQSPERIIFNTASQTENLFRLSFITLTISKHSPVSAKESHKALKVFLQHFKAPPRRKAISEQLKSYLWKCELQARGQIHYHVTANSFLHWAEIRRVWNGIQDRRGWLEDYRQAYGKSDPNSTDVHAVYKVKDIQAYLSKYLSKTGKKDVSEYGFGVPVFEPKIDGKVWDCSNDLKRKRFAIELDYDTEDRITEGISHREIKQLSFDRCEVFCTDAPTRYLSNSALTGYRNWLSNQSHLNILP